MCATQIVIKLSYLLNLISIMLRFLRVPNYLSGTASPLAGVHLGHLYGCGRLKRVNTDLFCSWNKFVFTYSLWFS